MAIHVKLDTNDISIFLTAEGDKPADTLSQNVHVL
jgi:hypothetical protein